ncbi:MAG: hypothetical protein QW476_02195 [Candidatus Bathyarchaeia archaeon]
MLSFLPFKIVYRNLPAPSIDVSFPIMNEKLCEVFKVILKPDLQIDLLNIKIKVMGVSINTHKFSEVASNVNPLPNKFAIKFLTQTVFRRSIYYCCPILPTLC